MTLQVNGDMSPKGIAIAIAARLFINGAGEEAQRLVLELPDGRNGGGWCQNAVIDQIKAVIQGQMEQP